MLSLGIKTFLYSTAFLEQLRKREQELKLQPDFAVDSYLKATSVQGKRQNAVTDFVIRVLGLEVSHDVSCPCNKAIKPQNYHS